MEAQLQTIINSLGDAVFSLDESRRITFLNDAAARIFGCEGKRVIGRPAARLPVIAQLLDQLDLAELRLSPAAPKAMRQLRLTTAAGETLALEAIVTRAAAGAKVLDTVALRGRRREGRVADGKRFDGHERILVVDDEELVRMVLRAVLTYRGYQIFEAEDGEDAVRKCADAAPPFDLILIDLHMPRLGGREALKRIRRHHPRARAILLSGGLPERETPLSAELKGVRFLPKPFENQELVRLVREVLDQRADPP